MNLARLGVGVGAVGCVGHDVFGRFAIDTLRNGGVDVRGVREVDAAPTPATLIINVKGEDRRFIHCAGANAAMTADGVDPELITQCKVLYVGGYLLMPALEKPRHARPAFPSGRRQAGVKTVLDVVVPAPGDHWPSSRDPARDRRISPQLRRGRADHRLGDPLPGREVPRRRCKNRRDHSRRARHVPPRRGPSLRAGVYPTQFVGGTGAGDAFDAGFIAGMLAGEDPSAPSAGAALRRKLRPLHQLHRKRLQPPRSNRLHATTRISVEAF